MIRLLHLRNPCTILLLDLNIRGTVGLWKAWVILVTIHPHPFKPIIQSDTLHKTDRKEAGKRKKNSY
jgi:hypothetical protein